MALAIRHDALGPHGEYERFCHGQGKCAWCGQTQTALFSLTSGSATAGHQQLYMYVYSFDRLAHFLASPFHEHTSCKEIP